MFVVGNAACSTPDMSNSQSAEMTTTQLQQNIPPDQWGAAEAAAFIPQTHHRPNDTLDCTKVNLPKPFVVCVVGASRGIGAGVAVSYAKAGASGLVLASRRISGLEETKRQCQGVNQDLQVEIIPCDISSAKAVAALATRTKEVYGRLDVVVVNSGISGPVCLDLTLNEPEDFQNVVNVNYVGTFHCAKYLIPLLLESPDGRKAFIAVSSFVTLLIRGAIANTQYCVSKLAQLRLMEYVHEQYFHQGLSSFSVHPGAVRSEQAVETAPESFMEFLVDDPELCGAYCVWLTKEIEKRRWLSGRLISANWDADELMKRKEEVVEGDLLKMKLQV